MKKIVMLMQDGLSGRSVYDAVNREYEIVSIIIEDAVPLSTFLKKRLKKLGFLKVFDQILFKVLVVPVIKQLSKKRIEEVKDNCLINNTSIPDKKVIKVQSVNDDKTIKYLLESQPDIVIVNGTRILSDAVLNATNAKFINMHMGITPEYRGVHGGYWAQANKDFEYCGVTIHFVDTGIDTGGIILQDNIKVEEGDNFLTYPLLQLIAGIPLMITTIKELTQENEVELKFREANSKLWTHPGAIEYLINFFRDGTC